MASKLHKSSVSELVNALGIAGSHSSGTVEYAQTGGEVKRLHAGIAHMAGIRSATLARRGLSAPASIFEGKRGFYQAFSDRVDLGRITAELGSRWELLDAGIKPYCVNGLILAPIRAIQELIANEGLSAKDVASITVGTNRMGVEEAGTIGPHPRQMQEAQFSTQFSIALPLARGGNDYEHYWAAARDGFRDPLTRSLAERVRVALDEEADSEFPFVFSSRVTVTRTDGTQMSRYVRAPGFPPNPLSWTEVRGKFRRSAALVLDDSDAELLETAISEMPTGRGLLAVIPRLAQARQRIAIEAPAAAEVRSTR